MDGDHDYMLLMRFDDEMGGYSKRRAHHVTVTVINPKDGTQFLTRGGQRLGFDGRL